MGAEEQVKVRAELKAARDRQAKSLGAIDPARQEKLKAELMVAGNQARSLGTKSAGK